MRTVPLRLAQVCLFSTSGSALRRFLEVVSGHVEHDDGRLVSFHMGVGPVTMAHHPPAGYLQDEDILVTLQVPSPADVDAIYLALLRLNLIVDDAPESTDWGWRLFYFRAAAHLVFEVGAPIG